MIIYGIRSNGKRSESLRKRKRCGGRGSYVISQWWTFIFFSSIIEWKSRRHEREESTRVDCFNGADLNIFTFFSRAINLHLITTFIHSLEDSSALNRRLHNDRSSTVSARNKTKVCSSSKRGWAREPCTEDYHIIVCKLSVINQLVCIVVRTDTLRTDWAKHLLLTRVLLKCVAQKQLVFLTSDLTQLKSRWQRTLFVWLALFQHSESNVSGKCLNWTKL